jgi:hypothetical protein
MLVYRATGFRRLARAHPRRAGKEVVMGENAWTFFRSFNQERIVLLIGIAVFVAAALALPGFLTAANLIAIVRSIAVLGILALGMGVVIIGRGIDLSDRAEFEAALSQSGMSMRDFREQLRKNMRIESVVGREVRSRIGVDEEVARRYYRDNPERFTEPRRLQVREVIVLEAEGQSAEDRAELGAAIRRELADGATLAGLVATYRDRGLTSDVIDHGWVGPGDLAAELQSAVWDLAPGSFSEPVESRGGLHILEVVERQEAGLRPYTEVAERVRNVAFQTAFGEEMASYLDELEEKAYIRLDPPPGAGGFRRASPSEMLEELGTADPPAEEPAAEPTEPTAAATDATADGDD